ncbi:hypothetical protein E2562_036862 [Oryza meyeriana var. granulata]|uniref:Uncharacterized protein n=1 Tax=Oryza meyeriana var. granulata TaxID=110450 RepID=A0A6G1ECK0_9ORYZ|nr:hypothetical protein E2562_036862 [Oryza meyeriana var. granulata]
MASQEDTVPHCRPVGGAATDCSASVVPEDFEFCVLPSGGLTLAGGADQDGMCVADEVFSDGKLLPLRLSSANSVDAAALRLLRLDSLDGAASASGFSSRSDSRSASSSSSSSSCVSRSTSQKSASSDCAGRSSQPSKATSSDAFPPPRRPLSSSLFYAHPSPSPRPSQRWTNGSAAPAPAAARRSTGSAPPASWGLLRLGVVGAPDVYPPRPAAARGWSRSARFEQPSAAAKDAVALDKKLPLGFLGAGLVCNCSPDAVEPEAAAAAVRRRRRRKAAEKNTGKVKSGQSTVRRSSILEWLEDLSISKEKTAA